MYKAQINGFLKTIKLELHPEKSKVIPLAGGVNLLGFRVFYKYKLLKKSNAIQMKYRIDSFVVAYKGGLMSKEEILERAEGWNAYAMHGDTYKMRKRIMRKIRKNP